MPPSFSDAHLDAITGWLTIPLDRLRVRDRLRELALVPWGDASGEGALLRMAAVRAALGRLVDATPGLSSKPAADIVVASGGAWSVAPAPAVALALADVIRRPGVRALGWDHARLLAPLGTIADPEERRSIMADLRDDLLVPLGSVVMPAGMRAGRAAGHLSVTGPGGSAELDLVPGGLELVDLPPGERAVVEMRFRDHGGPGHPGEACGRRGRRRSRGPPGGPAGRAAAAARPAGATARPAHGLAGGPVGRDRRMTSRDWLAEIPSRPLLERGLEVRFALPPGDRPLVEPGAPLTAGDPLLLHLRDRRIEEVDPGPGSEDAAPRAGARWSPPPGRRHREHEGDGELLAPLPGKRDRWRLVTGDHRDPAGGPARR